MEQRLLKVGLPGFSGAGPAGFTLVEALVSMGIALTVMLAVLAMFTTALRVFDGNRDLTVATNLANSKLADFKIKTVSEIIAENPKSDVVQMGDVQYTRTWTVSSIDVDGDNNFDMVGDIVKVSLAVDWTNAGKPHRVSMTTLTTGKQQ